MKILDSNTVFSSDNYFKQMDLSLKEKSEEKIVRLANLNSIRSSSNRQNPIDEFSDVPQIIVDRVSISHKEKFEYQYNYSESLQSESSVHSMTTGDITEYKHQYAIERLVGGVIDKNVVVNHIERKEDIEFSDQNDSASSISDTKKPNLQTRMMATQAVELKLMQTDIHFEEQNIQFASRGEVTTEDGRVINFSLDMSMDKSFLSRIEQETTVQRWQERVNLTDPLVISLEGKIPQLSDTTFEFDLDSDGKMENINFVNPGSGFLAFDKNSDNIINNGSELFGPGTGNGFEELAAFDEDQNRWIDENDAIFSKLSVWTRDENGEDLLVSLKDAGIGAISLDNAATMFNMSGSDNNIKGQLKNTGIFLFENGNMGSVHQIDLADKTQQILEQEKAQLALEREQEIQKDQAEQANIPELSSAQILNSQQMPEEVSNPLQDLIDRIEKLKEEMGRLYEKMNPVLHPNRFQSSKSHNYFGLNLDPSTFLFAHQGPIQSRGRYA